MPVSIRVTPELLAFEENAEPVTVVLLKVWDGTTLLLAESITSSVVHQLEAAAHAARAEYERQRVRAINPLAYELAAPPLLVPESDAEDSLGDTPAKYHHP